MIEIKITIPNDEIGDGTALSRRLAVLGYTFGVPAVPVIGGDAAPKTATELMITEKSTWLLGDLTRAPEAAVYDEAKPEPAKKRGRPPKAEPAPEPVAAEPTPNISEQPENRVDPDVEAQDAADEAAEVAATPAKELTAEDLRAVMGRYVNTFGLAEAQADGPKLFADALGTPPDGAEIWSVTLASKSQETLAKAIAAWDAAVKAGKRYDGTR